MTTPALHSTCTPQHAAGGGRARRLWRAFLDAAARFDAAALITHGSSLTEDRYTHSERIALERDELTRRLVSRYPRA